jgi:5-methyltetrahydrofolate--homocysteine methyltransferase
MTNWLSECRNRVLIIDGAMGTELSARGMPGGVCPEQWARENPLLLGEVHTAYAQAGADVLLTFTLGGTPQKLAEFGLDRETEAINWALARVARQAAPEVIIVGNLGPTGQMIEPLGTATADQILAGYRRQVAGLADVVDGFLIETMSALDETILAVEAARRGAPGKPVLASLTYQMDHNGQNYHTFMGVDPATAAKKLTDAGADAIGTNCGNGIDQMIGIVERLAATTKLPVFAEPNAGLPKLVNGKTTFEESAESMAGKVGRMVKAGARLVGGCCGTTPGHIGAIKAAVAGM